MPPWLRRASTVSADIHRPLPMDVENDERERMSLWMRFRGAQRSHGLSEDGSVARRRRLSLGNWRRFSASSWRRNAFDNDGELELMEPPEIGADGGIEVESEEQQPQVESVVRWDDNVGESESTSDTNGSGGQRRGGNCPFGDDDEHENGGGWNSPRGILHTENVTADTVHRHPLEQADSRASFGYVNGGPPSARIAGSDSTPPSTSTTVGGSSGAATGSLTTRSSSNVSAETSGTPSTTQYHYVPSRMGPPYRYGYAFPPIGGPDSRVVQLSDMGYYVNADAMARWEDPEINQRQRRPANASWDGIQRWDMMTLGGATWTPSNEAIGDARGLIGRQGGISIASAPRYRLGPMTGHFGPGDFRARDFRDFHRGLFHAEDMRRRRRRRDWWRRVWKWVTVRGDRSERNWRRTTRRMRRRGGMDSDQGDAFDMTFEALLELEERNVKRGLTKDEVEALQVLRMYEKADRDEEKVKLDEDECRICLQKVIGDDELIKLPCAHWYHGGCIRKWLQTNRTCPVCRKEIERKQSLKPQ